MKRSLSLLLVASSLFALACGAGDKAGQDVKAAGSDLENGVGTNGKGLDDGVGVNKSGGDAGAADKK